jgi:hypothetical protein
MTFASNRANSRFGLSAPQHSGAHPNPHQSTFKQRLSTNGHGTAQIMQQRTETTLNNPMQQQNVSATMAEGKKNAVLDAVW